MDEPDSVSVELYSLSVTTRAFDPELDQAFIYATWRNSMYYGSKELKSGPDPTRVFRRLTKQITEILNHATIRVACLDDSPTVIVGYVVFTKRHLDWVYVKEDYRQMGIATLMVPKDIETVTPHLTRLGRVIVEKKQLKEKNHGIEEGTDPS